MTTEKIRADLLTCSRTMHAYGRKFTVIRVTDIEGYVNVRAKPESSHLIEEFTFTPEAMIEVESLDLSDLLSRPLRT